MSVRPILAVLFCVALGAVQRTAGEESSFAGVRLSPGGLVLEFADPLDRYVVEKFSLSGAGGMAVHSSSGRLDSAVLCADWSEACTCFRFYPGIEAVFFGDDELDAAIRSTLGGARLGPTNWIYDAEVSGLLSLKHSWGSIESLEGMGALASLQSLDAAGNRIVSLLGAGALSALEELLLDGNGLTSLAGAEGLASLRVLDVSGNQLTDLAPLAGLASIEAVYADRNAVASVAFAASLLQLRTLDLSHNAVTDIAPLVQNAAQGGLGEGDVVYLAGNPIADESQVAQLRSYGVKVHYP